MASRFNDQLKKGGVKISSGDIFEVSAGGYKGYFQFLYKNDSFLNGHLVRGFKVKIRDDEFLTLEQILSKGTLFYGFTRVFEGLKEGFWTKIGNVEIESTFETPVFRITNDTSAYVSKSYDWYIWKHDFDKAKKIGALSAEYKSLPFSAIVPPERIVSWIENGRQEFSYLPE